MSHKLWLVKNQPFGPDALVPIPKMTPIATNPEIINAIINTKLIIVCWNVEMEMWLNFS